ncbi:ribonuclease P protein component [Candidatus Peregrinibacteria bacterium]|nr:ribonuclease P protein component [Candidatus Peregrinibacteria bacterium]
MLSKANRIRSRRLIEKLLKTGAFFRGNLVTVRFLPSVKPESGFAILVSKKVVANATCRNTVKRRISESLRLKTEKMEKFVSALVIAKAPAAKADYAQIDADIETFIRSINKA